MKFYRNAIILVVIVAILAGSYFLINKYKPEENTDTNNYIRLTDYVSTDIKSLTLENPDGKFVIVKKGDDWVLSSPTDLKYDSSVLSSIVINAASITADKVIEEDAKDLSVYGLDKPIVVTLEDKDGKITVIEVGSKTPTGSGYYAKLKDENVVYLISSYTGDYLTKDRNGLRSKKLFDFKTDIITSLSMERRGESIFKSVKDEGNTTSWQLTYPIKGNMNYSAVYPMLEALVNSTVVEFVEDNPADLAQYGLDDPTYVFEFDTTTAGAFKLLMGDEKEKGEEIYAKLDGSDEVFTLDLSSYTFLDKPLKEIVDVFAYIVSIDKVEAIDLTMDGKTTHMKLDVYTDEEGKMDTDKDKFYVDGIDASGKNEDGDQPFRKFYQALIGISIDEVDIDGKPEGDPEITIFYDLKEGSMKVEFIPKDENYYYVVRNGEYAGTLVKKKKHTLGIGEMKEAYQKLMDFLAEQQKKK